MSEQLAIGLLIGVPYAYLITVVVSGAYFSRKLRFHQQVITQIERGE